MKKFLTVLLALSVVFTYTVGTAFAYTADEVSTEKADMKATVTDYADRISYDKNGQLGSAPALTEADKNLTKKAVELVVNKIIAKYESEIVKADNAGTALDTAWTTVSTDAGIANEIFTVYAADLYKTVIADEVAALTAKVNAYVVDEYPTVNQDDLEAGIVAAKAAIEAATDGATQSVLTTLVSERDAFDTIVKDLKTKATLESDLETVKGKAKSAITSAASAFRTYAAGAYTLVIDNPVSTPGNVVEAKAQLNALDANIAALVTMYEAQINAVEYDDGELFEAIGYNKAAVNAVKTNAETVFATTSLSAYENAVEALAPTETLLAYAKTLAEQKKLAYNPATGLAMYNVATVDKALANATAAIYVGSATTFTDVAVFFNDTNVPTAEQEKTVLESAKTNALNAIKTGNYDLIEWRGDNADRAEAIQDEYTAKIKAATTVDAITKLETAAKTALDKIIRADSVAIWKQDIKWQMGVLDYCDGYGNVGTKQSPIGLLMEHAVSLAAKNPSAYSDTLLQNTANAAVDFLVEKVINTVDASKTTDAKATAIKDILKANYAEALAIMSGIKTDAELDVVAKAVEDAIAALPTVVTLEDNTKYVAAQTALEDYVATPGAAYTDIDNRDLLDAYMTKLISLEKAALQTKLSALPKLVTVNDKATIEDAEAAYKAYNDTYGDYSATGDYDYGFTPVDSIYKTKIETAKTELENAMLVDAAKKIAELPNAVTVADKVAVEAARAAYDALTDEQKEAFSEALLEKLIVAEKALVKLDIKAVESLKIKASSSAVKGKITVKWTVKGDVPAGTVYKVYKSTKAQSGYAYMGKTTKNYMANKKNLKKGKRYFYKVKAVLVVDGQTYTSDWSNKANRFAK